MKNIILITIALFTASFAFSQSKFSIRSYSGSDSNDHLSELVDFQQFTSLSKRIYYNIALFNSFNTSTNRNNLKLVILYDDGVIENSYEISHPVSSFSASQMVLDSGIVYIVGNIISQGSSEQNVFILKFDFQTRQLQKSFLVQSKDYHIANPKMVINDNLYLAHEYNSKTNTKEPSGIVLTSFSKDLKLQWSQRYFFDSSYSVNIQNLILSPNQTLLLSCLTQQKGAIENRIRILDLDIHGIKTRCSELRYYNSDRTYEFRTGRSFLAKNGSNIHLVSQAFVGRSDAGPILVTMIDTSLTLRTWRNYTPTLRIESFSIADSSFIFCGQAPVANGLEGYGFLRINASNAIPQKESYIKDGFRNFSIASSGSAHFQNGKRNYIMVAKPNEGEHFSVAVFDRSILHACEEPAKTSVSKDPVTLSPVDIKSAPNDLYISTETQTTVQEIQFTDRIQCEVNSISDPESLSYTIQNNSLYFQTELDVLHCIDLKGRVISKAYNSHTIQLPRNIPSGLFIIQTIAKNKIRSFKLLLTE